MSRYLALAYKVVRLSLRIAGTLAKRALRNLLAAARDARRLHPDNLVGHLRSQKSGWYGNARLGAADIFKNPAPLRQRQWLFPILPTPQPASSAMAGELDPHIFPYARIEALLASRAPAVTPSGAPACIQYSLLTHLGPDRGLLVDCIESVAKLVSGAERSATHAVVEWIWTVEGEGSDVLLKHIPDHLKPLVVVRRIDLAGETADQAIRKARGDWLVLIEADVEVAPFGLMAFEHYVRRFPACRWMASAFAESGGPMKPNRAFDHRYPASRLFEFPGSIDGINALRRDLLVRIGCFDRFPSPACYFDLALRVAAMEPILLLPELLCRRRSTEIGQTKRTTAYRAEVRRLRREFVQSVAFARGLDDRYALTRSPNPRPDALVRRGACIIRSQGKRLELLQGAIASVEQQAVPTQVLLAVHGDDAVFEQVQTWCDGVAPSVICIHAAQSGRRRGYPLNVALDYVTEHATSFDFVCILDDDDILYPSFSVRLAEALEFGDAGLVYAQSNRREPWLEAQAGPSLLPAACLLGGNFIPINSFVLSVPELIATGTRFSEELEYLEDWDFLLRLLRAGVVFRPVFETLSEFRIFGDGNTLAKKMPHLYHAAQHRLTASCIEAAGTLGCNFFYADVCRFDYAARDDLTADELAVLDGARNYFETAAIPATRKDASRGIRI